MTVPAATPARAYQMAQEYRALNSDLSKATVEQLLPFYLVTRVGRKALDELYGRPMGPTPRRHRAWYWWNAFLTSGIPEMWEPFVARINEGEPKASAIGWVKDGCTEEEWRSFSRRMGSEWLDPTQYSDGGSSNVVWTKGGNWWRSNNFTKVLVLKEYLQDRGYAQPYQLALGPHGCETIERDLHLILDGDVALWPDAHRIATEYVRRCIPEQLGWNRVHSSYVAASWFFQEPVYTSHNYEVDWRRPERRPIKRRYARVPLYKGWYWWPGDRDIGGKL